VSFGRVLFITGTTGLFNHGILKDWRVLPVVF